MFAPEDLGAFQLKTSGNLVGEIEVVPDKRGRGMFNYSFILESRRRFKRELESQSQPVLERVSYKTDEVNRNWSGLILIDTNDDLTLSTV